MIRTSRDGKNEEDCEVIAKLVNPIMASIIPDSITHQRAYLVVFGKSTIEYSVAHVTDNACGENEGDRDRPDRRWNSRLR